MSKKEKNTIKKRGRPPGAKNKKTKAIAPKPEGYIFGRPTKYRPEYCEQIVDFFDVPDFDNSEEAKKSNYGKPKRLAPPTIEGFCRKLKISTDTITIWSKKNPDFFRAVKLCKEIQKQKLVEGTLMGDYNAGFAQFVMKNCHNWADKIEQKTEMDLKVKTVSELVGQIE